MVEHPFIYEINTWVWLDELRPRGWASTIGLAGVPAAEWDAIAALGFDAVWLMGVWERSPAGIAIALQQRRRSSRASSAALPGLSRRRRRRLAVLHPRLHGRAAPRRRRRASRRRARRSPSAGSG